MKIRAKVGTMPMLEYRVAYKRKPLKIGDRVKIKQLYNNAGHKWLEVIVDKIEGIHVYVSCA